MEFKVEQRAKKFGIAAVVLTCTAGYIAFAGSRFLASTFAAANDVAHLSKAARLDPGNAEYASRLGVSLLMRPAPDLALPWLESATQLNPHKARYWLNLAIARESLGDLEGEKAGLTRALAEAPADSAITWEAANLFLAQGSFDDAMKGFRIVMENSAPLMSQAIQTCWKVRPDASFLLENVVPPKADESFLNFLISKNEITASDKVWERMYSLHQPVSRSHLFEYVRFLISHQQPVQAAVVWRGAAEMADLAAYEPSSENLLVNGDFSLEILNGGFDWLHQKIRGVSLALDPNESHSGSRSLRIVFDGPGIDDAGIRQIVAVEPNTEYEFSAFFKAQEMDGAGGARFAIQDLYRETPFLMSDELRDADFWKKTGGRFVTGPETRMIMLRIARLPAGSPIRGKLWIDGLQLVTREHELASAKEHL